MGKTPADRVKTLLGKLDSVRRSEALGYEVGAQAKRTSNKFVGSVARIFKNLPKPVEWRSFYNNDLPILMDICKEVQEISIQDGLNRSQTRALETLKAVSEKEFQRVTAHDQGSPNSAIEPDTRDSSEIELKNLSAREIKGIAEKAAKKASLTELNRARVSPAFCLEKVIFMMSRLGISVERIAKRLDVPQQTISDHLPKMPELANPVNADLSTGFTVQGVAEKHACPVGPEVRTGGWAEAMAWSLALEGKENIQRFKELNWGLRTWERYVRPGFSENTMQIS